MAEFAYNNIKNFGNIDHMPFKLNYNYHPQMSYKKDINPWSKSQLANKLATDLKGLMIVYKKKL